MEDKKPWRHRNGKSQKRYVQKRGPTEERRCPITIWQAFGVITGTERPRGRMKVIFARNANKHTCTKAREGGNTGGWGIGIVGRLKKITSFNKGGCLEGVQGGTQKVHNE